jgi:hypothetical protein
MPYHLALDAIARIEDALREPPDVPNHRFIKQLAVDFKTTEQTIYYYQRRIRNT